MNARVLEGGKMGGVTKTIKVAAQLFILLIVVMYAHQAFATNLYNVYYRTNTFNTADSKKLNYRSWTSNNSKAVIVYLSGMQTHSQWFNDVGDELFAQGYNVYALDRRGSGLSGGTRGDIIFYQTWITDLHQFIKFVKSQNPGRPVHLMANCFGTRITLAYSLLYPGSVKSLIHLTPGVYMNVDVSSEDKLKIAAQTTDKIEVPIVDTMHTSDPEKLDFMAQDTLMLRETTARLQMQGELLDTFIKVNTFALFTPMLVLMSADDEVIDVDTTISNFYKLVPCKKKLVEYQDVRHFLLFENSKDAVLDEIGSWVDNQ